MQTKIIVGSIVAVVLAGGGATYYFTSASNPNAMSRDKAATLILASLKQGSTTISVSTESKFPLGVIGMNGISCGDFYPVYSSGVSDTLVSEGYLSRGDAGLSDAGMYNYAPTTKANPYIAKDNPYSNILSYVPDSPASSNDVIVLAQAANVDVTGITDTGQNTIQADFTETNQLTPFGQACSYPTTANGTADLQLYDDGWRVVDVNF